MFPPPTKAELEQSILASFYQNSSVAGRGQYVSASHEIVTRCDAWAELLVNDVCRSNTESSTSGTAAEYPGDNWTGVMADIGNQRYGTVRYGRPGKRNEDGRRSLHTCAEGKCMADLMSRGVKADYFRAENDIVINMTITFDRPCPYCNRTLQDWVNQYKAMCKSMKVVVHGRRGNFTYE